MTEDWAEVLVGGKLLWRHTSGAQVYESEFWKRQKELRERSAFYQLQTRGLKALGDDIFTWKAQRAGDVLDGDDDGYIYPDRESAMEAALKPYPDEETEQ